MTDREYPEEYVSITREDVVNIANTFTAHNFSQIDNFVCKNLLFNRVTDVNEEFRGRNDKFIFEARTFYGNKRIRFDILNREIINFSEIDIIENNFQECNFLRNIDIFMCNGIIYNAESYSQSIFLESDLQITKIYVSGIGLSYFGFEDLPIPGHRITIDFIGDRLHNVEIERDERINHFATTMSEAQQFSTQFLREYYSDWTMPRASVSIGDNYIVEVSSIRINTQKSNTFSYTKKDNEIREFIDGPGLFKIGVKKFNDVLPIKEQWEKIKELSYVNNWMDNDINHIEIGLKEKGDYIVCLKERPTSFRVDSLLSYQNPFLSADDNHICLGNMKDTYEKCWHSKNILECVKIIKEVLNSNDDSQGYRSWKECK